VTELVVLFLHVPKTGGTTLIEKFKKAYGPDRCSIQDDPLSLRFLNDARAKAKSGTTLFAGHVTLPEVREARRQLSDFDVRLITIFREPIDHFFSAYLHHKTFATGEQARRAFPPRTFLQTSDPSRWRFDRLLSNITVQYLASKVGGPVGTEEYLDALRGLREFDQVLDIGDLDFLDVDSSRSDLFLYRTSSDNPQRYNTNSFQQRTQAACADLIDKVAELCRYDLRLHRVYRRRRDLPDERVSARSSTRTIYVSEFARRVAASVHVGSPDLFKVENNDFMLHPAVGSTSELIVPDLPLSQASRLVFSISLEHQVSQPIKFEVLIRSEARDQHASIVLNGGQRRDLALELPGHSAYATLIFRTELAPGSVTADWAWAWFRNVQVTRH
jgi:hypothetical protein